METDECNHKNNIPKEKALGVYTIAFVDLLIILAPVLILLIILFFEGKMNEALNRPEWSFVTVFYLIEILKDQIVRHAKERYQLQQSEAGVVFYSLALVVGVLILYLDFRHSAGSSMLDTDVVYLIKFSFLGVVALEFFFHRVRKLKLLNGIKKKTLKQKLNYIRSLFTSRSES